MRLYIYLGAGGLSALCAILIYITTVIVYFPHLVLKVILKMVIAVEVVKFIIVWFYR